MKNSIEIRYEEDSFRKLIPVRKTKEWILKIFSELNLKSVELSVFFCNNSTIQELNARYRHKDRITDVLSFSQLEDFSQPEGFLGDAVISIPQAQTQAENQKHSLQIEVEFLLLHSILHLIGYDHETDDGQMDEMQKKIYHKLTGEVLDE